MKLASRIVKTYTHKILESLKQHDYYKTLREVMMFVPKSMREETSPNETALTKQLRKDFFHKLYIDRDDIKHLQNKLTEQRVTVLLGYIGTGKTVTLLRLEQLYNSDRKEPYIKNTNCREFDSRLLADAVDDESFNHDRQPAKTSIIASDSCEQTTMLEDETGISDNEINIESEQSDQNLCESRKFIYIPLDKTPSMLAAVTSELQAEKLINTLVCKNLDEFFLNPKNRIDWQCYMLQHDLAMYNLYTKANIYRTMQPDENEMPLSEVIKIPSFNEEFRREYSSFDPATLVSFIRSKGIDVILALDNVDAYEIHIQRYIYNIAVRLSVRCNMAIVVSFRDYNFKQLSRLNYDEENAKYYIRPNAEAYYMQIHEISALDDMLLSPAEKRQAVIAKKNMLKQLFCLRLNYVQDYLGKNKIEAFNAEYSPFKISAGQQVDVQLTNAFEIISNGLVFAGFNAICNNSIRLMLLTYMWFVLSFVRMFKIKSAIPDLFQQVEGNTRLETRDITKLRTLLYRWLVFYRTEPFMGEDDVPNVLTYGSGGYVSIDRMVLEYLYHCLTVSKQRMVRYEDIIKYFIELRVRQNIDECRVIITDSLLRLEKVYTRQSSGYILLHRTIDYTGIETVELLPAGDYFLKVLSTSREYLFWAIMNLDLDNPDSLHEKAKITEYETNVSKFKLEIVIRWLEKYYMEKWKIERDYVKENYRPMILHVSNNPDPWANYSMVFGNREGWDWYFNRVIIGISSTLQYSGLSQAEEDSYRERLNKLTDDFNLALVS